MKTEFKNLFKTKKGVLVLITIIYAMVLPYLTILTLRYPGQLWGMIDFGTLCLSFIPMLFGDILAECFGWKKATVIASVAYLIQLIFVLILHCTTLGGDCFGFVDWISMEQSGDPGYAYYTATEGYSMLFGAQWRILLSSAIAYYVGIFSNSFIMGVMKAKAADNDNTWKFFARCILSTIIGQFLDNALFFILAMAPFGIQGTSELDWATLWKNIGIATGLEVGYEIVLFPLTKLITKKVSALNE